MTYPLRSQFMRTICDCPACRAHCRRQPGPLAPEDVGLICDTLEIHPTELEPMLVASPGALVIRGGQVQRIPTITPARQSDGSCTFLAADGRCSIHDCAPFGCAHFDHHMDAQEGNRRATALYRELLEHGEGYYRLRAKLERNGQISGKDDAK